MVAYTGRDIVTHAYVGGGENGLMDQSGGSAAAWREALTFGVSTMAATCESMGAADSSSRACSRV